MRCLVYCLPHLLLVTSFLLFSCTPDATLTINQQPIESTVVELSNPFIHFKGTVDIASTNNALSISHSNQSAFADAIHLYYKDGAIIFQSSKLEFQLTGTLIGNFDCEQYSYEPTAMYVEKGINYLVFEIEEVFYTCLQNHYCSEGEEIFSVELVARYSL